MNIQHKPPTFAERLNAECFCMTLDRGKLLSGLAAYVDNAPLWTGLTTTHPNLFARGPAFIDQAVLKQMMDVVDTVERVVKLEAYKSLVMSDAADIAKLDFGPLGVMMGYDFHIATEGPKIIEINTNAGGAFLNAALRKAQTACCAQVGNAMGLNDPGAFDPLIVEMFKSEWQRFTTARELKTIAIADDKPEAQYLYPEFLVTQALLRKAGFEVLICDSSEMTFDGKILGVSGQKVDLIYNRLTDFTLEEPLHLAIRQAYENGAVALTPNPHHHALYANKHNLTVLSDVEKLAQLGVSALDIETLRAIPKTRDVTPENADALWAERRKLFFKPKDGYGGKAVYRGDKITKTVWDSVRQGNYIAQELVQPSERNVADGGNQTALKMDVRLYTYDGNLLIAAARLYQGQTTNFRTLGGGFSPLFVV